MSTSSKKRKIPYRLVAKDSDLPCLKGETETHYRPEIHYRVSVYRRSIRLVKQTHFDRLPLPVRNEIVATAARLPKIGKHKVPVPGLENEFVTITFDRQPTSSLCILLDYCELRTRCEGLAYAIERSRDEASIVGKVEEIIGLAIILRDSEYVKGNFILLQEEKQRQKEQEKQEENMKEAEEEKEESKRPRKRKKTSEVPDTVVKKDLRDTLALLCHLADSIIITLNSVNDDDTLKVPSRLTDAGRNLEKQIHRLRMNEGVEWV